MFKQIWREDIAIRTRSLYNSVLEASLTPPNAPKTEWRGPDTLANNAYTGYNQIRGHKDFVPYFRTATPEPELGQLNIGSRPEDGQVEA